MVKCNSPETADIFSNGVFCGFSSGLYPGRPFSEAIWVTFVQDVMFFR